MLKTNNKTMLENTGKVTFGIRYSPAFKIEDVAGEIVDNIFSSPAFKDKFDATRKIPGGRALINKKTEDLLSIDRENLVIVLKAKNIPATIRFISETAFPLFVKFIFEKYSIKKFNRLGMVFSCQIRNGEYLDESIKNLTKSSVFEQNEFFLRFSKKTKTIKGEAILGEEDYKNVIFTIEKNNEEEKLSNIDIDYQHYFMPATESIHDIKISDFVSEAQEYVEKEAGQKWVDQLIKKEEKK